MFARGANLGLIYGRLRYIWIVLVIMLAMASAVVAEEPGRRYVGSKRSDKYHLPDCKWAKKIGTQNQIWFDTIAEAKAAEYKPCSVCKPEGAATAGDDNAWIYWLIGILAFLAILRWLARHKPKPHRKYQQRDREHQRWLQKHRGSWQNNPYQQWLQEYEKGLPKDSQTKLTGLRSERRGKPYYPQNWRAISAAMRRRQTHCEVCGAPSEHVHHRQYRESGSYEPGDLIVLCSMCHYCIHPGSDMSQEAFINGK